MRLCHFTEADWSVVRPWFPPTGSGSFMDLDWLEAAAREARCNPEKHSLLVGYEDGRPVAVCSFTLGRDPELRAVVSMLVPQALRRSGIGRATVEALRETFPEVAEFVAYLDPENAPSLGLLRRFGFIQVQDNVDGRHLFVWRRDHTQPPSDWKPPASRFSHSR